MKRIRTLPEPPTGLAAYLVLQSETQGWDEFRSHESGAAYQELRCELVKLQHGLCGYCEIRLVSEHVQVEHVTPQSDDGTDDAATLDSANMMACCLGGTKPMRPEDDPKYHLAPIKLNISCGQAKGGSTDAQFIDPRTLPALPSLLMVLNTGEIEADATACANSGFQVEHVRRTIEILGLNVKRLVRARQRKWRNLNDIYTDDLDTLGTEAARVELTLGDNGLPPFFTTARTFFGPFAETVLNEPPREWI